MVRMLLPNEGPDGKNVAKGFAAGIKMCRELGTSEMMLIVPHKGAFPTTAVGKFIGEVPAKRMVKGETITIEGVEIRCESIETIKKAASRGVALVFYVDVGGMRTIDGLADTGGIVYVPWLSKEGEAWQQKWNAGIVGKNAPAHEPNLDLRVIAELERLTSIINLSTGLGHQLDESKVRAAFQALRDEGVRLRPEEIEIWAVRNGWSTKHAADLMGLAAKFVA